MLRLLLYCKAKSKYTHLGWWAIIAPASAQHGTRSPIWLDEADFHLQARNEAYPTSFTFASPLAAHQRIGHFSH